MKVVRESSQVLGRLTARILSIILMAVLAACAAADKPLASVVIEGEPGAGVVTFAHPFVAGEVTNSLVLKANGRDIPAQVDIKRRYPDGSVKHAIFSAEVGGVGPLRVDIYPAEAKKSAKQNEFKLPDGFSANVILLFPDGGNCKASAAELLKRARAGIQGYRKVDWLAGHLANEVQISGPPLNGDGKADPDLHVIFGLRLLNGGKSVRLGVVVESPWLDVPGNIPYDVSVLVAGDEVMSKKDVGYWNHRMPTPDTRSTRAALMKKYRPARRWKRPMFCRRLRLTRWIMRISRLWPLCPIS